MIKREAEGFLRELARGYYVVAVTGPRQSGKTTLVQAVFPEKPYLSLEDLDEREFAMQDPRRFLQRFPDGAILDEVQRCPDLFSYLQTRVDADRQTGQFILTGSQQFGLLSKITQSLAGRVGLLELLPFSLAELQSANSLPLTIDALLYKGFYPPLYDRTLAPSVWYKSYVQTYIERDARQISNIRELSVFQRFIRLCAARTGQLLNLNNLANECGITHNTAKSWISLLETSYLVFLLQPHFRNFNKRLVKTPKLYFYDTGLVSWLLGIQSESQLSLHPSRGSLFENYIISECLKLRFNRGMNSNLFFWRNNTGDEVGLIIDRGNRLIPVEVKSGHTLTAESFKGLLKWISLAKETAGPGHLCYGGEASFKRGDINVVPWNKVWQLCKLL